MISFIINCVVVSNWINIADNNACALFLCCLSDAYVADVVNDSNILLYIVIGSCSIANDMLPKTIFDVASGNCICVLVTPLSLYYNCCSYCYNNYNNDHVN